MNFDVMNTACLVFAVLAWAFPLGMRKTENGGVKKVSKNAYYISLVLSLVSIVIFAAVLFINAGSVGFTEALAQTQKVSTGAFVMSVIMLVIVVFMIMPEKRK